MGEPGYKAGSLLAPRSESLYSTVAVFPTLRRPERGVSPVWSAWSAALIGGAALPLTHSTSSSEQTHSVHQVRTASLMSAEHEPVVPSHNPLLHV